MTNFWTKSKAIGLHFAQNLARQKWDNFLPRKQNQKYDQFLAKK